MTRSNRILLIFILSLASSVAGLAFHSQLEVNSVGLWYVATTGNDANDCMTVGTPCATIVGALAKPGFEPGDTILVAEGVYEIGYDGSYEGVFVTQSAILSGGWDEGFIDQQGISYLENAYRGITIVSGITVTIDSFHVSGGSSIGLYNQGTIIMEQVTVSAVSDSGVYNEGTIRVEDSSITHSGGCGIMNAGTIVLTNTLVTGNYGCGITNGGIMNVYHSTIQGSVLRWGCTGISNTGSIRLVDSAIVDNGFHYPNPGAGLCNFGQAIIVNSTISSNRANSEAGGGIYSEGSLALYNTTVNDNQASTGGGIYVQGGSPSLQNSLIAQNVSENGSNDCSGNITSLGYNLIGNTIGCSITSTVSDLLNLTAFVFPVMGNSPPYAPISFSSPAIDVGDPTGCKDDTGKLLTTDQRGVERLGRCDIGAYEYDPAYDPLKYLWLPIILSNEK